MIGIGTLLNTGAIVAGGLVGLLFSKGLKEATRDMLMKACGIAVIFIGVSGALSGMLTITDGIISTKGTMLLIFSLVLGSLAGQWIDIESKLDILGEKIKKAIKRKNDSRFVDGFVNASLTVCIGAMAIVGSMQDGMSGDFSMLAAKSVLDFVVVIVFASAYGLGAVFSAVPVLVYQGVITLIAAFCGSFVSQVIIDDLSFVGSVLIFCVGVNLAFGKKFKVGNMLPALIIPVLYEAIIPLFK